MKASSNLRSGEGRTPKARRARALPRRRQLSLQFLEQRLPLAAFPVTVTDDAGPGSLREAILAANANPGPDRIEFNISGAGVRTISLLSPLPEINDTLELDGRSQPGYAGIPLIELDGSNAGILADGLVITASDSSVHGLIVNRFDGSGIILDGASSNLIQATFVGVDATGLSAAGNGRNGIQLTNGAANNLIGGLTIADRNVIGGHSDTPFAGVFLIGAGTENNTVAGNLIGLGVDGQTEVGNFYGVRVENASGVNTVGGDVAEARNVISGNVVGAWVANSPGTSVSGNYIGTDVSGLLARGNTNSGVQLLGSAGTLGGPTPAHGNLIAGTTGSAHVSLANSGSGVVIQNNWMGTDATGSAILGPRTNNGIAFNPGAFGSVQMLDNTIAHVTNGINTREGSHVVRGNRIGTSVDGSIAFPVTFGVNLLGDDNLIGGTTTEHRNIIVADNTAITVSGDDNEITGNWIGVYGNGLIASPSIVGILMQDGAARTLIGGFTSTPGTGAGNVIAGTTFRGILLTSSSGNDTRIRGNIIGLAADGVTDVTIGGEGIRVTGGLNAIIGGDDAADGTIDGVIEARNIISGFNASNQAGIGFSTSGSNLGTRIQGNYIGTDITGTLARGNNVGVAVGNAPGTVIGGTTAGAGNVISASSQQGVYMFVNGASTIQGNIIGLNAAGNSPLPNSWGILASTSGNLIGGDTPGARNVISGNTRGVEISSVTATNNVVQGNYIGTDITGLIPVGNAQIGVHIQAGATNNTIGGSTTLPGTGRGNVIAGNTDDGIRLDSDNNFVFGNLIGLGSDGSTIIPNSDGVEVRGGNANTIGGLTSDLRNVISGNQFRGITVNTDRLNNVIQGNFVGTDRSGLQGRGNGGVGVQLNSSLSTVVGGPTSTTGTGAGNVISGNLGSGIQFGGNSDNAIVQGNLIGLGVDGSTPIGNGGFAGVYIFGATGAGDIQIGGDDGLSGNVISANPAGIIVRSTSIDVNIEGNHIGTDITGTLRRGNLSVGIAVQEQLVSPVVIGGSSLQARNLISANDIGISIESGSTNVDVLGNYIGTTLAGTAALGNRIGVRLANGAFENVIGGSNPTHRNLISGNSEIGLQIDGSDNDIQGNAIGTGVSETQVIGGGTGIVLVAGSNNQIGGLAENEANVIAYQQVAGLRLLGNTGSQNNLQRNRYVANLGPGIDGGPAGLTLNDPGDLDNAPNYPVMTQAVAENGELTIEGFADTGISFDLFLSSPSSSGFGQGAQYLGSFIEGAADDLDSTSGNYGPLLGGRTVSTGSIAAERFRFVLPVAIDVVDGDLLTIVRTGSMSEFSPALIVGQQLSRLAPTIALDESSVTLVASERLQVTGSFDDPDSTSWTATVDFGDGSGPQPLVLAENNTFVLDYQYASPGSYAVTVSITDNSQATGQAVLLVLVQNEAPVVAFNDFTVTSVVSEGQLATLTGRFEDVGGTHAVQVNWGDGTIDTINLNPGERDFVATHTYLDDGDASGPNTPVDVYRVVVTVVDDDGASSQTPVGLFLIDVQNVRPGAIQAQFSSTSVNEGQTVTISNISFVDPGVLDVHQVTIDWGDGSRETLTLPVGARTLSGLPQLTHTYLNNPADGAAEYLVTISVVDDDEPFQAGVLTQAVTVANVPPQSLGATLSASVISEGGQVSLSGSFADPGVFDRHQVVVDWGDGSPQLTRPLSVGQRGFTGLQHTYQNNKFGGGDYEIVVRVIDLDDPGSPAEIVLPLTVLNVAPTLVGAVLSSGGNDLNEGDVITVTGSFDDVSSTDRHAVTINWGDGISSAAQVDSLTRTFTASHRFRDDSSQITATVTDSDGDSDSLVLLQTVLNVAPAVDVLPDENNDDPNLVRLVSQVSDPGTLDTFTYQWSAVPMVVTPPAAQTGTGTSFDVDRSLYPSALWRVTLTVTDDDGGVGTAETVLLAGTGGDDSLTIDNITFSGANTNSILVLGFDGDDIIDGSGITDPSFRLVIDGGAGQDLLFGGSGDDIFILRSGDDSANITIPGGPTPNYAGNDRYILSPNSTLTVVDLEGDNTLDFGLADFGITYDLSEITIAGLSTQDVAPTSDPGNHFVAAQGVFNTLSGSQFADDLTGASFSTVYGVAGDNRFTVKGFTVGASFVGGADDDLLQAIGTNIVDLTFLGDDGLDTLLNFGQIQSLTFGGGADDDILINQFGATIGQLNFSGDDGLDLLENLGSITVLTFGGGADDDLLVNSLGATIGTLSFLGDDGLDQLINRGEIGTLTFGGGADDDLLLNDLGATILQLSFTGDDGLNRLENLGSIVDLTFTGGADDDVLRNLSSGFINDLNFSGDDGSNLLENLGQILNLTFSGGADDDVLVNQATGLVTSLNFSGDDGLNQLFNFGEILTLTFSGGADDDLLFNQLDAVIGTLVFTGDDGANLLENLGTITELTFSGGADDDVLINRDFAVIGGLVFTGDDGLNSLSNLGQITSLQFGGGADDDVLFNATAATIGTLVFTGDDGLNSLRNFGAISDLVFNGGADDDVLVNNAAAVIGQLSFFGDDGANLLINAGQISDLLFQGGADDDTLLHTAGLISQLVFNGDDGADLLNINALVTTLQFSGGADDDILLLGVSAAVGSLIFNGDAGADLLRVEGIVSDLTFFGGADDDTLFASSLATISQLVFGGDDGNDVLWNEASELLLLDFRGDDGQDLLFSTGNAIAELIFSGGADDDVLLSTGLNIGQIVFSGDDGDDTLVVRGSGTGVATSTVSFIGGTGIDAFRNDAVGFHSLSFQGGADDDVFVNNAAGIVEIFFGGDDGQDVLENNGAFVQSILFSGDDGLDIFVNDGASVASLVFIGGADDDLLLNTGNLVGSIVFEGGADDDTLFNTGSSVASINFTGDDGMDRLINDGPLVGSIFFSGGADDDLLWNRGGTQVGSLVFVGDDGADLLRNDAAGVTRIEFLGGADDDRLENRGDAIAEIFFSGDDGADVFLLGGAQLGQITMHGGADDDILAVIGFEIASITFSGDIGADVLLIEGSVTDLTFNGGADDDLLLNNGGVIQSLVFNGDDGQDILVNSGTITSLEMFGGADDDILQNNGPVVTLIFHGDDGNDSLLNNAPVAGVLRFFGGNGSNTLINNASGVAAMEVIGGPQSDTVRVNGSEIGDLLFIGNDGPDSLIWNATGTIDSSVVFDGGLGNDFLAVRGSLGSLNFIGGAGDETTLLLGSGDFILNGGEGNDTYIFGPNPSGTVQIEESYSGTGDVSVDLLDFSTFVASSLQLDLRATTAQPLGTQLTLRLSDGLGIENVVGTQFDDVILGNARDNRLLGADLVAGAVGVPVARRSVTQWVLLDFDTQTSPGEHVYTTDERQQIRNSIEEAYRGPDSDNPWFDVRVTDNIADIPSIYSATNDFATITFNATPPFGRPGGLASEIDPGNFNLGGTALVQINGMLGGVIQANGDGLEYGNPEEDRASGLLKGISSKSIRDEEVGALKPAATSENFVILSAKIGAHELAHLLGLRHHDAFGPIGFGLHDPPGSGSFKPVYNGPSGAFETFNHLIGSPASVGSTRFDDLQGLYFGEREAVKLTFAFSDPGETFAAPAANNHSLSTAQPLTLVPLSVPITLQRGLNRDKSFTVELISVVGRIEIDPTTQRSESDWYSFSGRAGDLVNIDVLSNSIARFGSSPNDFIDSVLRVYDSSGNLVPYYGGFAENDDMFEPTDSTLIDLFLPADGIYFIEVDTFNRFGDPLGDSSNPASPFNPANPNNLLDLPPEILQRLNDSYQDTDQGQYQLILYRFAKANTSIGTDVLKGLGGNDQLDAGPEVSFQLDYALGAEVELEIGTTFSRTIMLADPGASEWTGSTVDYGDGIGPQTLIVDATGQFELSYLYSSIGTYEITVIIANDIGQIVTRSLSVAVTLPANVAPEISIAGPDLGVRGEPRFYTFNATDLDPEDAAGPFVYSINWGDGSPIETVTGGNSIERMHIFTDGGVFDLVVTATDSRGLTSQSAALDVTVEQIQVRPDPLYSGQSILVVGGSTGHDLITVHSTAGRQSLVVTINGNQTVIPWRSGGTEFVHSLAVYAQAGNDIVTLAPGLNLPALLDGGAGNDILTGGRGSNILIGGDGNDVLLGFGGRDLLIGGLGSDFLYGGTGDDLLIAGYTTWDHDRQALDAIMREWDRNTNFASRRRRLTGEQLGGLNGSYLLKPQGEGRTVFDDDAVDFLWGGSGRDWFLANTNSEEESRRDILVDLWFNDEEDDIDLF